MRWTAQPFAGLTVLAVVAMGAVACSSTDTDSDPSESAGTSDAWRIGVEAPLSGDQATLGQGMLQGAELAAEQINDKGGVLGKQIEIVQIDDAADPETGVAAAQAAIADGLDGVVGPYNSGVGIKTLPLYIDAGLLPIRLTSDNDTDGDGFTLQPMTDQIAPVTATALTDFSTAKTVGIIYDSSQNYTKSTSQAVEQELKSAGVEVTAYQSISPGEADYSDVVSEVAQGNPDVIYSAVYFPEGALIAEAMQSSGSSVGCLLDYASYDNGYIEDAGVEVAQTCDVVGVPAPADFSDSREYVSDFEARFGNAPGTWSPYTYDSVNFLVDGVTAVGGFNATDLTTHLQKVSDWQGWTGSVTIESSTGNRNPATVVITEVDDEGEFHVSSAWATAVGAPY